MARLNCSENSRLSRTRADSIDVLGASEVPLFAATKVAFYEAMKQEGIGPRRERAVSTRSFTSSALEEAVEISL